MKLILTREVKLALPQVEIIPLPIFSYEAIDASLPDDMASYSKIIFVSPRAVEFSQAWLAEFSKKDLYVTGPATQKSLAVFGYTAHLPEKYSSEGVLALAPFQHPRGEKILIVRGEGGREFLAEILTQRGAVCRYFEVYRRRFEKIPGDIAGDAIWLTSEMALEYFASQVIDREILLLLGSERVAARARVLGFRKIEVLQDATEEALKKWCVARLICEG